MEFNLKTDTDFARMYEEFYPKIYNYVYYRLLHRQNTEDIVSDIFMKVVAKSDSYDPSKAMFSTWIYRIAQNTVIDYYRSRKISECIDDYEYCLTDDSDEKFESIENNYQNTVRFLLSKLPDDERELIYLKYFEDMKNKDIAVFLDINESTVSTKFSRILKKLKKISDDNDIDTGIF